MLDVSISRVKQRKQQTEKQRRNRQTELTDNHSKQVNASTLAFTEWNTQVIRVLILLTPLITHLIHTLNLYTGNSTSNRHQMHTMQVFALMCYVYALSITIVMLKALGIILYILRASQSAKSDLYNSAHLCTNALNKSRKNHVKYFLHKRHIYALCKRMRKLNRTGKKHKNLKS